METMSKSEFAADIGVVPSRVTAMLADGTIGPEAIVGEGRFARIIKQIAKEQIAARRNVGQALGNGLHTRLDDAPRPPSLTGEMPLTSGGGKTAELIALERLEQERRRNRVAQIDEAKQLGQLVDAEDVRREIGKVSQQLMNVFLGMAPDIANAIASKFSVPQRDALHLVRQVMTEKRGAAAAALKTAGAEMPETVEKVIAS